MTDDLSDSITDEDMADMDNISPEDVFSLVTIIPGRKMRVKAHLIDKDGEKIELSEIAQDLVKYTAEKMKDEENNQVNTQVFPLMAQLMVSYIPRVVGLGGADLLFGAPIMRGSLINMAMAAFLMLQYIRQHNLKIVTEEEEITDLELEALRQRDQDGAAALDNALRQMIKGGQGGDS